MSRPSNGIKDQATSATLRALRRAARRARELGARTGTPVYIIRNDRIVDLTKENHKAHKQPINSTRRPI